MAVMNHLLPRKYAQWPVITDQMIIDKSSYQSIKFCLNNYLEVFEVTFYLSLTSYRHTH